MQPGEVRNDEFFRRRVLFTGLRYMDGITPTDIDGVLEFKNKLWIVFEIKHGNGKGLPYGQKLALERMVDDWQSTGKPSVGIVARHTSDSDVIAADCQVECIRWDGRWIDSPEPMTMKEFIDRFVEKHLK